MIQSDEVRLYRHHINIILYLVLCADKNIVGNGTPLINCMRIEISHRSGIGIHSGFYKFYSSTISGAEKFAT